MYMLPNQPFTHRQALINMNRTRDTVWQDPKVHRARVRRELKAAGLSPFALSQPESAYLHRLIHPHEHIGGAVFGRHKAGLVMLVATDLRIIFLDNKPLFTTEDEINFNSVTGVSVGTAGFGSTVSLHTRVADYTVRTYNHKSATNFVAFIEQSCLENSDAFNG